MSEPKEVIQIGEMELRFLLDGGDTNETMVVFEFSVPPGAKVPAPHSHEHVDELVYGLAGTMTTTAGDAVHAIGPGARCFIPRGTVHHHSNEGSETATVLTVLTPASIGPEYFRELATLLQAGGPPDPEQVREIMSRHGLVVA